jgi:2-polyprenyl-3-methyl-5-hydroxy-6-metoxy-1,4-benzoquinol methylase
MSQYSDSDFKDDPNSSWYKSFALIPEKAKVMDVGCSSGTFGEELIKKKACVVDGIEIDDGDIAEAKKKLRNVYKIDVERDPINIDHTYDVIFFGDVVEHLANPARTLEIVKRLLNEDGILVFSIPNITHMSVRLMFLSGEIQYGKTGLLDETHLHFYNREEIYRVFNEAGYKIKKFDYTVNDVPIDLAKSKLAKLGLTPNDKFEQLLKSTNAAAYQFIGVAVKSKDHKRQPLPASSPDNIVGDYINELKADYEDAIKGLKLTLQKTSEDRDRVVQDRDRLQEEMSRTIAYRTLQYARRLKINKRGKKT